MILWSFVFSPAGISSRRLIDKRLLSINKIFIVAGDFEKCKLMMGTKYGIAWDIPIRT